MLSNPRHSSSASARQSAHEALSLFYSRAPACFSARAESLGAIQLSPRAQTERARAPAKEREPRSPFLLGAFSSNHSARSTRETSARLTELVEFHSPSPLCRARAAWISWSRSSRSSGRRTGRCGGSLPPSRESEPCAPRGGDALTTDGGRTEHGLLASGSPSAPAASRAPRPPQRLDSRRGPSRPTARRTGGGPRSLAK